MLTVGKIATLAQSPLRGNTVNATAKVNRIVTDSRQLQKGDFFVALKGQIADGHQFIAAAFEKGAVGAMVAADFPERYANLIYVTDTRLGLGAMAQAWRLAHSVKLIGITGSNGKTTTKEMLTSILRAHTQPDAVLATPGNFNNDIGLPLTLLGLNAAHRYAVIEMGMNHTGEIAYLTGLAHPDIAVTLNALRAHLGEGFSGVEGIARAKAEIFDGLPADGVAVIHAEDPYELLWVKAAHHRDIIRFGLQRGDVRTEAVLAHKTGSLFTVITPQGQAAITLNVPGRHNIKNAVAAIAVAIAANVPLPVIAEGLAAFNGIAGRLSYQRLVGGTTLIDDTYNANPDSMRAAIDVLVLSDTPTILVMGDMGELGDTAPALHEEVGRYAKAAGVTHLLTLGELSTHATQAFGLNAHPFEKIDSLLATLDDLLQEKLTVLVKGSRYMKMERVVQHLNRSRNTLEKE